MMNEKVSIIIPTYNQANYIEYTLKSVQKQIYQDWECIIIDDGSTDNTEQIVKNFIKDDIRFIYIKKENGGASSARNLGLDKAKGNYIQFLDSDDYLDSVKLSKSIEAFEQDLNSNIVITNFKMFQNDSNIDASLPYCNLENEIFNYDSLLLDWDIKYTIPLHCALFKKNCIGNLRFEENIQSKEDWVMWLSIFKNGLKTIFLNEYLAYYRVNEYGNHTNDDKNFIMVTNFIFKTLNDSQKEAFFNRMTNNLLEVKFKLKECSYYNDEKEIELIKLRQKRNSLFKKIYKVIKNQFKNF